MSNTLSEVNMRVSNCEACSNLDTSTMSCSVCSCPMVNVILEVVPCPIGKFSSSLGDSTRHGWFLEDSADAAYQDFVARNKTV